MTLTTFSSKQFKPLYKWSLKRNTKIAIVFTFLLILLGPILDMYCISIDDFTEEIGLVSLIIFEALSALFTLISAMKTFSFLHNKRSVDLFGALPSNRTTLCISHLLGGITAISIPYIVAAVLTIGIAVRSGEYFRFALFSILANILMIIAAYTFTALIAYCCGTIVDTAIITLAVNGIWVGMVCIYYMLLEEMIPGIDFDNIVATPILIAFSPYGFSVAASAFYSAFESPTAVSIIIWNLIYIIGVFFLTLFVANKRKSEVSQNGFAVKWLPIVVQAGASVVAGGIIGVIAAETAGNGYGNMYIFSFWFVIIGFVAFAALYIIFNRGFKGKKLASIITYICTMIVSVSLLFGLTYGLGIDTYVPSPSTIKKVDFGYGGLEFKNPENIKTLTEIHKVIAQGVRLEEEYPYYMGYENSYYNYIDEPVYNDIAEDTYRTYDEPDMIYDYESSANSIAPYNYGYNYGYNSDCNKKYPYVDYLSYRFNYTRKIGFAVQRTYNISPYDGEYYDINKLNELSKKLVSSQEYKEQELSVLYDPKTPDRITSLELNYMVSSANFGSNNNYYNQGSANLSTYSEVMNPFLEALKEDIAADESFVPCSEATSSYNDSFNSYFAKYLGDRYMVLKMTYLNPNYGKDQYDRSTTLTESFVIKSSYTKTIELLSEYGVKPHKNTDYSSYADYPQSYYDFADTGDYSYLETMVRTEYQRWASIACDIVDEDYNSWAEKYSEEYKNALLDKTNELYNKHKQELLDENGYIDNYDLADNVYMDLISYAFEYVEERSGLVTIEDIDPDTDTNTSTDTDDKTVSKPENTSSMIGV